MHYEMELLVRAGMSPLEAIQACTSNPVVILNRQGEFGSLEEGLIADILIVSGDPARNVSDTRNIKHVIVRGGLLDRRKLLTSWQ